MDKGVIEGDQVPVVETVIDPVSFRLINRLFQNQVHKTQSPQRQIFYDSILPVGGRLDHKVRLFGIKILIA